MSGVIDTNENIEKKVKEIQNNRSKINNEKQRMESLVGNSSNYDDDIYKQSASEYVTSIPPIDRMDGNQIISRDLNNLYNTDNTEDPFAEYRVPTIADREDEYHSRFRKRGISPERQDPFTYGGDTPVFSKVMKERDLDETREDYIKQLSGNSGGVKRKWTEEETPLKQDWDQTPLYVKKEVTPVRDFETTPKRAIDIGGRRNRWDSTAVESVEEPTPGAGLRRSRWDLTPANISTPVTPKYESQDDDYDFSTSKSEIKTPINLDASTPVGGFASEMMTPTPSRVIQMTPEQIVAYSLQRELDARNRQMTDEELDSILPAGYKILKPPASYVPIRTPARKITSTPTPITADNFFLQKPEDKIEVPNYQPDGDLPVLKPDDLQYFKKLMDNVDENQLDSNEKKEREIMAFLLKIKNGTPLMRKSSLRQITEKARYYGAGALFGQILPLLMSPTLEDQERHLLVKTIDRILYKLDDLVRPYVHKILVVIEPMLIDEDYYARVEAREIISNLAKAAGLATMISTLRPDIDNIDEYVRNTTARAFAVVASALGIPSLLPFLKAVCRSRKSWQARHTGVKIIQQIAVLMGCAILPHLKGMVEIIEKGLEDDEQKVRSITAMAIAAMAEASTPYGIESFVSVLKPLWKGIKQHRGKGLAAFLKAVGCLIPLIQAQHVNLYIREVMIVLIREFNSADDDMKKTVLKVVKQCCATDGIEVGYIKSEILTPYFRNFWNQRMSLDKRNYQQVVDTTVEIAGKVGGSNIIWRIVDGLKADSEQFRKMSIETIEHVLINLGSADINSKLEELLVDGILYAYQEQTSDDNVVLNGFGAVVNALGERVKPYLPQTSGTILWRLNSKSAKVRQQAADLITRVAPVMKLCQEDKQMSHLSVVLYEYLGEEYPDVLGSILAGLKSIVNVVGMTRINPPIKDLLPRLTPILKNRNEKVQENCIDLIGRIADRGAEFVSPREWMRICFELLDLLKAHKKSIRRAAVNTFGYIAKAIGPHDVLATLLNNLKVQERQNRVCTTVAIAIVAETCSPFTVLPSLMNEYRVPELNVQNGVLKALSFMFEYIGEMAKDYIYAVMTLLQDALMDRDLVHRQTAMSAIGHMAIGVYGFGCEDALMHLINYTWPNILETSPHVVQAFMCALEGFRIGLGPIPIMQYCIQGLFHPARRVRDVSWRAYNTVYIGNQDALTLAYPRIPDEGRNHFVRYELDYII